MHAQPLSLRSPGSYSRPSDSCGEGGSGARGVAGAMHSGPSLRTLFTKAETGVALGAVAK